MYDNIKRGIRRSFATEKKEKFKTGGGPYKPPVIVANTDEEQELMQNIQLSCEGLAPMYDNDSGFSTGMSATEVVAQEPQEEDYVTVDWSDTTPAMLQIKKSEELMPRDVEDHRVSCTLGGINIPNVSKRQSSESDSEAGSSINCRTTPSGIFDNYLTFPFLTVSRRKPIIKKKTMASAYGKFEHLAVKKLEFVEYKSTLLKQEHEQTTRNAQLEHERRIRFMEGEHNQRMKLENFNNDFFIFNRF